MIAADDRDKLNIGARRKHRVGLQSRADRGQVDGLSIGDEKHRVRIADADTARVAIGRVGERHMSAVDIFGERNLGRRQLHRSHVDGDLAIVGAPAVEVAGEGLDGYRRGAAFLHQQRRHTARAIAAGLGDAAVGVVDIHPHGGARVGRRPQGQKLVAADAPAAIGHGPDLGHARRPPGAPVNDHEVIAEAVHFGEFKPGHGRQDSYAQTICPKNQHSRGGPHARGQ